MSGILLFCDSRNSVQIIQVDGMKRHVYIKLADADSLHALLQDTAGQTEYKYPTGEISIVHIALAGSVPSAFALQTCHRRHQMIQGGAVTVWKDYEYSEGAVVESLDIPWIMAFGR